MVTCFAGEIGIPCVKFRNFRSKWQGVTEANLEKILNILKALSPVAVMIDEADAFLGDREPAGDSGTSNRIFAQIASFMGNTEYRGKIIWFLITCRPDLLPIDLKRQGRAEEHLALFYPQTDAERDELFARRGEEGEGAVDAAVLRRAAPGGRADCRGADIEAVLVRAKFRALAAGPRGAHRGRRAARWWRTSCRPPTRSRSSCRTWWRCRSAPAASCCPRSTGRWSADTITRRIRELKMLLEER